MTALLHPTGLQMTVARALVPAAPTLVSALVFALCANAQTLPLMPWPATVHAVSGSLDINPTFTISISGAGADPRVKAAAQRTLLRLSRQTGIPISTRIDRPVSNHPTLQIVIERRDHKEPQRLSDDESYSLQITADRIQLSADGPLGALRGLETFLQLVQQNHSPAAAGFSVPYVDIRDQPRFPWRGLSLDVSRHFIPVDEVERTIDGLAAVKLNVLHWHLSDDQGFRVESKKFPRLQDYGSDSSYYTQAEVRAVVAYARDRGGRV